MNPVERTVIAATQAYGDTVREIRPLELRPEGAKPVTRVPRARRWKTWMTPVTAAAAVVALAISLVIVRDIPNGRVVPPAQNASTAIPRYYVALGNPTNLKSPDPVVIGDMRTGQRLDTVKPPAHHTFGGVTAAADDRTFVLDVRQFPWDDSYGQVRPRTWYLLRLHPGTAHPVVVTSLPIPPTPNGAGVDGIALSPDGSELAVMFEPNMMGYSAGPVTLRIYSVATGKLIHSWTGPKPDGGQPMTFGLNGDADNNTTLAWTDGGRSLAFVYSDFLTEDTTVRILDPARPGHALLAGSRVVLDRKPGSGPNCRSLVPTADGLAIACGATGSPDLNTNKGGCATATARNRAGFYMYSAATGKLSRVLYQYTGTTCYIVTADIMWVSPSGGTLIGRLNVTAKVKGGLEDSSETVVLSQGKVSRLSFPLAGVPLTGGIAW